MHRFPKPVVYISKCITFAAVRYDGGMVPSAFVDALKPFITPIIHCPEVEIGLPVPRKPIRVAADDIKMTKLRLIQPDSGADLTDKMKKWVKQTLDDMKEVDGFILKSRSPSSGAYDVRIYPSKGGKSTALTNRGAGFFGGEVIRRFIDKPIEDDDRLNDEKIADSFLKGIFTNAAFRKVKNAKALVKFQEINELLFMSFNRKYMRILGDIAANVLKRPFDEVKKEYTANMALLFSKPYRVSSVINIFRHALGYFPGNLSMKDKKCFFDVLNKYRSGGINISVPTSLMKSYVLRFDEKYLKEQTFFLPYPGSIMPNHVKNSK
jgi:uncharacterized protein YbgA (DUF1722 family)/uncharacterized protein YbbK (DUF523 family)